MPHPDVKVRHGWFLAEFVYGAWTECLCGFRPNSQAEMDVHDSEVRLASVAAPA